MQPVWAPITRLQPSERLVEVSLARFCTEIGNRLSCVQPTTRNRGSRRPPNVLRPQFSPALLVTNWLKSHAEGFVRASTSRIRIRSPSRSCALPKQPREVMEKLIGFRLWPIGRRWDIRKATLAITKSSSRLVLARGTDYVLWAARTVKVQRPIYRYHSNHQSLGSIWEILPEERERKTRAGSSGSSPGLWRLPAPAHGRRATSLGRSSAHHAFRDQGLRCLSGPRQSLRGESSMSISCQMEVQSPDELKRSAGEILQRRSPRQARRHVTSNAFVGLGQAGSIGAVEGILPVTVVGTPVNELSTIEGAWSKAAWRNVLSRIPSLRRRLQGLFEFRRARPPVKCAGLLSFIKVAFY